MALLDFVQPRRLKITVPHPAPIRSPQFPNYALFMAPYTYFYYWNNELTLLNRPLFII
jgi:hypothetical protein